MKYTLRMLHASKFWTQAQAAKKLAYQLRIGELGGVRILSICTQTYLR